MTNKLRHAILVSSILLFALFVRVYHYHHILMSDEAQNMLTIKALIEGEGIREYFFKHPPLFILLAAGASYPVGDSHRLVQGISIVFSVLSFIPLYLIVRRLFDERTALLSMLFLAVMPLNIIYSTWVKQEAMLLFFFTCSLWLYISGRPFKSGIILGVASLTKEFACFLIPITFGWELLKGWEGRESSKRFFLWLLAGGVLSAWWYIFFGRISFEAIGDAIAGGNLFEYSWHHPWHYYARNIPSDLGPVQFVFFCIGLLAAGRGKRFLPVLWVAVLYVTLSLMRVKAPWYTYLASPALAVIVAAGFREIRDKAMTKGIRLCIVIFTVLAVLWSGATLKPAKYYGSRLPSEGRGAPPLFYEDEYLDEGRKMLSGEEKVALLEYNPTLQYYLGIADKRLAYLGPQFPAMERDAIGEMAAENGIGWFVIDTNSVNYINKNVGDMVYLWGKPREVGALLIFDADVRNFR